jgi:hypothetical protein
VGIFPRCTDNCSQTTARSAMINTKQDLLDHVHSILGHVPYKDRTFVDHEESRSTKYIACSI